MKVKKKCQGKCLNLNVKEYLWGGLLNATELRAVQVAGYHFVRVVKSVRRLNGRIACLRKK
jgi:hypothetical protein